MRRCAAAVILGTVAIGVSVVSWGGCASAGRFPVVRPVARLDKQAEERLRAEEYFIKARDYDRRGLSQMAERFYEMAVEFDPASPQLRELLVGKYIESGKYTQALLALKRRRDTTAFTSSERRLLYAVYLKMGQFKAAADALAPVADKSPQETYSLALIYESLGDHRRAAQYYRASFDVDSGAIDVGLHYGALLLRQKAVAQAESLLAGLRQRFGESAKVLNFSGEVDLVRGDTGQALNAFRMALAADSTCDAAITNIGEVYLQQRNYKDAIRLYEELARRPEWTDAVRRSLVLLYYYDDQLDKAAAVAERLLSANADDPTLHYYLGLVRDAQDSTALARLEFEKSLALDDRNEDAWRQLCHLGLRQKDPQRALADAGRFTRALPKRSASWRTLGRVHNARKEYDRAIAALQQAIGLDSADSHAWFELGSAFERSKRYEQAAVAFGRVLALKPEDPVTANYLGYMWAEQNTHLDSAAALLRTALRQDSANGAYLDSYAWIFYQKGMYDSAHAYITKAIARLGDDPVIYTHLGDILARQGRSAEAISAYEKALALEPDDKEAVRSRIQALRNAAGGGQ